MDAGVVDSIQKIAVIAGFILALMALQQHKQKKWTLVWIIIATTLTGGAMLAFHRYLPEALNEAPLMIIPDIFWCLIASFICFLVLKVIQVALRMTVWQLIKPFLDIFFHL